MAKANPAPAAAAQSLLSLEQWVAGLTELHLPRWADIPDLGLYMDQVLAFLDQSLQPLAYPGEKLISATMINNYVKQGLVAKPEKKKYGRRQIAMLVVICVFKQISGLMDIRAGVNLLHQSLEREPLYNIFCERQEQALCEVAKQFRLIGEQPVAATQAEQLLTLASGGAAGWIAVKALIHWNSASTEPTV